MTMRKSFTIESERGGFLDLLNDKYFYLTDFDGETYGESEISSTTALGFDGDIINDERVLPRVVNLELTIKDGVSVEEAKRHICQVIKLKHACTFRMTKGEKSIVLTGKARIIDMPRYKKGVVLDATFHCSDPFWADVRETIQNLTGTTPLHFFTYPEEGDELFFPEEGVPFSVYNFEREQTFVNEGDSAVGLTIRIVALGEVINPIIYASTGEYIGVNTTMQENDVVTITTHKGNKTAKKNGENILDKLMDGSSWLQLETGRNTFNIDDDTEDNLNMYFEIEYKQRYI